jgi:hypothetical protein
VVGSDPSTGKDNLIFGMRVISEGNLRQCFCPTGIPFEVKQQLGDQVLDAVARPGRNLTTNGESGVFGLTEALQNLKGEAQVSMGGDTPSSH